GAALCRCLDDRLDELSLRRQRRRQCPHQARQSGDDRRADRLLDRQNEGIRHRRLRRRDQRRRRRHDRRADEGVLRQDGGGRCGQGRPRLQEVVYAAVREQGRGCRTAAKTINGRGRPRRRNETGAVMRALLALLLTSLIGSAAAADNYPSRPIKLLIPFPPAGITDLSGRIVAESLRAKLGQPVVVENKPGANGVLGLRELLKADADGYTLMVGNVGSLVINYAIDTKASFDPLKDVVPIAGTSEYPTAMVVNNKMPVKSVKEFIAYAKERPGKLTFGSTGVGAMDYLAA